MVSWAISDPIRSLVATSGEKAMICIDNSAKTMELAARNGSTAVLAEKRKICVARDGGNRDGWLWLSHCLKCKYEG